MASAFATLEGRVTDAVFSRLANVQAALDGVLVAGMFESPGRPSELGVAALTVEDPMLVLRDCDVPDDVVGKPVLLGDGRAFTVRDRIPDGLGVTRLILSVVE